MLFLETILRFILSLPNGAAGSSVSTSSNGLPLNISCTMTEQMSRGAHGCTMFTPSFATVAYFWPSPCIQYWAPKPASKVTHEPRKKNISGSIPVKSWSKNGNRCLKSSDFLLQKKQTFYGSVVCSSRCVINEPTFVSFCSVAPSRLLFHA